MQPKAITVAVLAALAALPALAQQRGSETDEKALDRVIVTGTRAVARTVSQSASPIDVITPEALEATGTTELATALSRTLPSLNFPRPAISDASDAVRPAQLRGLAPDQVLVLVNGKRRHSTALVNLNGTQGRGSSPADLNAIPISAIDRVEVLRDGASAQYGSDAIAGVINIILKGHGNNGSASLRVGQYSAGDGRSVQFSTEGGFGDQPGNFIRLATNAIKAEQTDRARPFAGTPGATTPPLGVVVQRQGDPAIRQGGISLNGAMELGTGVNLYGFANWSRRNALSNGFFRPAGDARNVPQIYPNGFLPQIRNIATDHAAVIGIKSQIGEADLDVSYNYGHSELTFDIENTLNRSMGVNSPTRFYAGALRYTQHVLNADLRNYLDLSWTLEPMTFALGAEWRGESFSQQAGEPTSYINGGVLLPSGAPAASGAQVFPGFRPSDARSFDRHSMSLYADAEAIVSRYLTLGVAGRVEKYSDFGFTSSGKATARWEFSPRYALRGTYSTGFRAPSLQQQFFQSTATNFISVAGVGTVPFDIRTFRVNDPAAIALGAEPLKPERSKNLSLGFVMQPVDGMYVTIDAYRIRVRDRIVLSENLTSTAVRNYLNTHGFPDVGGGRYFTNAIDTTTTGLDVIGTYRLRHAASQTELMLGYNANRTTIDAIAANPATLTAIDPAAVRFGRTEVGRLVVGAPRNKAMLGANWSGGPLSFAATATRYGSFTVRGATPVLDQTFGAKWLLDLSASYKMGKLWDFSLGVDNLFDTYPDEVIFANSTSGQLPYSGSSPFGFNGAYVYGSARIKW